MLMNEGHHSHHLTLHTAQNKAKPSSPIIQREKSESAFSAALKGTNPTHKVTKKSGCSKLGCVWVLRSVVRVELAQHTSF